MAVIVFLSVNMVLAMSLVTYGLALRITATQERSRRFATTLQTFLFFVTVVKLIVYRSNLTIESAFLLCEQNLGFCR